MFYTLVSKYPAITGKSNKRLFYIFLIGSILYIMLHYYLFSMNKIEIIDKFKSYIYYVMFADLGLAYFLSKSSPPKDEDDESDTLSKQCTFDNKNDSPASVMKDLEDLKRLQQLKATQSQKQSLQQSHQSCNQAQQNLSPVKQIQSDQNADQSAFAKRDELKNHQPESRNSSQNTPSKPHKRNDGSNEKQPQKKSHTPDEDDDLECDDDEDNEYEPPKTATKQKKQPVEKVPQKKPKQRINTESSFPNYEDDE